MKFILNYKKIFFILIIVLTNILTVSSQNNSQDSISFNKSTKQIIKRIEKQKYLMTNFEIDKRIIELTNKLANSVTDKELVSLTDSKNYVMSCIAFWILVKRDNSAVPEIYKKYKEPERIDSIFFKCKEVNKNIGNTDVILIYTVENFYYEVYVERKYLKLLDKL